MALLRARRWSAAIVAALAVPAVLAAACTISSEAPDATSLGGRAGPSSGTTTTATTADGATGGATPPGTPEDQPREVPSTDGGTSGTTVTGATSAETEVGGDTGGTGSEAAAGTDPSTATTGSGQAADEQPADQLASGPAGDSGSGGDGEDEGPAEPVPATDGPVVAGETAFDERSKVSTVGIGAVYFGMSPEEASERVGTVWAGVPAGGADCYVVTPTNGPPGVALWVYHGTVERVDIDTPLLRTQSGLGVGTHLGELRSRLGEKLVVEEHPFLAGWILATFVPTDPNDAAFRLAFDVSGGEVIRFRAGRTEIVALESCA